MACSITVGNGCTLYYLTEPISQFLCNPFHYINRNLRLECNVYQQQEDEESLVIEWYRIRTSTESEEPQKLNSTFERVRTRDSNRRGIKRSKLIISSLSEQDAGDYWCKVLVNGSTELNATVPSQKASLKLPDYYQGLPPCPYSCLYEVVRNCAEETSGPTCSPSLSSGPYPKVSCSPSPSNSVDITSTSIDGGPNSASEFSIPAWGYGVIVCGIVIALCSIFLVVLVALYLQRRKKQALPSSVPHQGNVSYTTRLISTPLESFFIG